MLKVFRVIVATGTLCLTSLHAQVADCSFFVSNNSVATIIVDCENGGSMKVAGVNQTVDVSVTDFHKFLKIFPNPSNINVIVQSTIARTFHITSLDGRRSYSANVREGSNELELIQLPAGIYVVQVDGNVLAERLVILQR